MFKSIIRNVEDLLYRRIASAQYLILNLVMIFSLALVDKASVPGEREAALHPVSYNNTGMDMNEATKLGVLQWMKERSKMSEQVLSKIYNVAMNNVNTDLVLAICLVESNFNPHVESDKGAIGLMGIMPDVWLEELQKRGIVRELEDLYTISSNMNSGIYVLGTYLARTNNLKEALSRYAGGDPAYATKVLRMRREISQVRRSEDQPRFAALMPNS